MAEPPSSASARNTRPLLVGREHDQAALRDALAAALVGRGSLVLIGGEAGIGKTTLAEATLDEARGQGALALVGRCYDLSETPPYGPWRELFAHAPAGDGLPALPAVVLSPERDGETLASTEAIGARVVAYLAALAARQTLSLLLDDLHWADPASLDLLRVVARGLAALPLLLLATYRADEVARGQPLATLLPLLVREARAARLDLRPLDRAAIGALLATRYALDAADHARLADYLAARSEGNALFLGELLRTLEGVEALRRASGGWHLGDLTRVRVPVLLRQVIEARLQLVDPETERLLTIAAVVGQVIPLAVWAAAGELTEDDLVVHVERALAGRLLSETPDGDAVRFAHALIREALYEGIAALRRRALHRRVAEALMAQPAPDPDAVAYHLRQAGDARAAEWLVRAGERARVAYAWATAAARYEAALAVMGAGDAGRAGVLYRLGLILRFNDTRQGLAALDEAAGLLGAGADRALAARLQLYRGHLRCFCDDMAAGIPLLRAAAAALEALPADERAAAILDGADATNDAGLVVLWLAFTGHLAEAETLGSRYLAQPAAGGQGLAAAAYTDVYSGMDILHGLRGNVPAARAAFARAHEISCALGYRTVAGWVAFHHLVYAVAPYEADDPAAVARAAERIEADWRVAGGEQVGYSLRLAWLPALAVAGHWTELRAVAEAAPPFAVAESEPALALVAAGQGDRALLAALLDRRLPAGSATEPGVAKLRSALALQRVAATQALDAGDLPGARTWLAAHDRWLAWSGAVLGRAEGQLGWAAYHRAAGDLIAAQTHAESALAYASEPRQPLALLAAHRALGELDSEAGQHSDAQAHLDAALALADACAAPYERALTLLALAELRAAEGRRDEGGSVLGEARAVLEPLAARPALARADALAARLAAPPPAPVPAAPAALPFGLTPREAEVLRLVAEGLPDAQIAARLFVGRSTVNSHLKAVFGKLGVNTRAAAARVALDHGLR